MTNWAVLLVLLFSISPEQFPRLGVINFYGLRAVSEAQVRPPLGWREGDTIDIYQLEKLQRAAERRIAAITGVQAAFRNFGCCTPDGKSMLYVGIEEKNSLV